VPPGGAAPWDNWPRLSCSGSVGLRSRAVPAAAVSAGVSRFPLVDGGTGTDPPSTSSGGPSSGTSAAASATPRPVWPSPAFSPTAPQSGKHPSANPPGQHAPTSVAHDTVRSRTATRLEVRRASCRRRSGTRSAALRPAGGIDNTESGHETELVVQFSLRKDMTALTAAASGSFTIGDGLAVNRLGFGSMRLTGKGVWGPPRDPDEAVRVLRRAVELGVNLPTASVSSRGTRLRPEPSRRAAAPSRKSPSAPGTPPAGSPSPGC
jgi:hypothetical protein